MITVLLDSSNVKLCVGICEENNLIDYVSYDAWQQQSEFMIPELDKMLSKHSFDRSNIKNVMVAIGPGSYTGVRIAITIAKIIGTSLGVDVVPISSLQCQKDCQNPSICLINARSGRSYIGVYNNQNVILADCIMTNDEVLKYIDEHKDYSICGNTNYLGIEGKDTNTLLQMASLNNLLKPCDNVLALKPIYMKD